MLSHRRLRWKRYIVIRLLTVGMVGFPTTKKVFVASLLITSAYIWAFRPVQTVTKVKSFMVATVLSGQTLLQSILNVTIDSEIVEDDNLTVEEREIFRKANGNLAMGKYLILVVANMGHREFALNLIASFHRNHNEKFLVVCLDRLLYGSLVNASEGSHAALVPETWLPRFNLTLNEASFGSKDYSPITQAKMVITNQFVQRSYTVFFHDVDLVWLSPFVLEYIDRVEPKTEVIYMVDIANHWNNRFNTGFYVVRPTDGVKQMFTEILSLQANKTDMMDGDAMVVSFNLNSRCKQLSSAPLDKCLFPCGKIYHHDKFPQRIDILANWKEKVTLSLLALFGWTLFANFLFVTVFQSQQEFNTDSHGKDINVEEKIVDVSKELCSWTKETQSALDRVKTDACRKLIEETACSLGKGQLFPSKLPHSCPKDDPSIIGTTVGCFIDEKSPRLLGSAKTNLSSANSLQSCLNFCFKLGYSYGGVEYAVECHCGNSINATSKKVDLTQCQKYVCPGNSTQYCGGLWRISVFSTGLHQTEAVPLTYVQPTDGAADSVRIVFLLTLNGRSSRQIFRLLNQIYTPKHFYYIHVDARQDFLFRELIQLESQTDNIRLKQMRFATIWGGASLLTMILDAVKDIFQLYPHWQWDFMMNLSETDFPVLSLEELEAFLTVNRQWNFAKSHGRESENFVRKQGLEWAFVECENRMWRLGKRSIPEGVRVDGGSDWVVLNRQFLHYVTFSNDVALLGLKEYYRYALLPAESFFHTVLLNSVFCATLANANLKLTNWRRSQGCKCQYKHVVDWCGCSPNVFRISDLPKLQPELLRNLMFYFARKFEPMVDQLVIDHVETNLISFYQQLTNTSSDDPVYNLATRSQLLGYGDFWLNEYHHLDKSPTVATAKSSLIAGLVQVVTSNLREDSSLQLAGHPLQLTIYRSRDNETFLLLLGNVSYYTAEKVVKGQMHVESKFSLINRESRPTFTNKTLKLKQSRIKSIAVGTDFDPKELIFRSYTGAMDEESVPTARLHIMAGSPIDVQLKWIDPQSIVYQSETLKINKDSQIMSSPLNKSHNLIPGVWTVEVVYHHTVLVDTQFPILPDATLISHEEKIVALLPKFYKLEDSCWTQYEDKCDPDPSVCAKWSKPNFLSEGLANCKDVRWSSQSPDPKSNFNPMRKQIPL